MCFLTRFLTHLLFSQKFCFRNSVVQFSRIDAHEAKTSRQLCYYIIRKTLCQALFSIFFKVFWAFFGFCEKWQKDFSKRCRKRSKRAKESRFAGWGDARPRAWCHTARSADSIPRLWHGFHTRERIWKNRRALARRKGLPFFRLLNYLPVLIEFS